MIFPRSFLRKQSHVYQAYLHYVKNPSRLIRNQQLISVVRQSDRPVMYLLEISWRTYFFWHREWSNGRCHTAPRKLDYNLQNIQILCLCYLTLTSGLSIAHRSKQYLSASLLDGSIMVGDGSTISVREKAEAGAEWEPLELHLVAEGLTLDCVRTNRAEIMTMVN